MPPEMLHFMSHYRDEFWSNKPPGLLEVTYYLLDAMLQPSRLYQWYRCWKDVISRKLEAGKCRHEFEDVIHLVIGANVAEVNKISKTNNIQKDVRYLTQMVYMRVQLNEIADIMINIIQAIDKDIEGGKDWEE